MKIRVSPEGDVAVRDVSGMWEHYSPAGEYFEPEYFLDREVEDWEEFEFTGERV